MATTYFRLGAGNWNDGSLWSLSSGGAPASAFPVAGDTANFDANSTGITTVNVASAAAVISMATTFAGTLTQSAGLTVSGSMSVLGGTFNSNGQALSVSSFICTGTGTRSVTFGASTITVNQSTGTAWNVAGSNLTFSAASSTILLANAGASAKTFLGGGQTYGALTVTAAGAGAWTINNSNTWGTWTLNGPKTITLVHGTTQIVAQIVMNTSSGNLVTLQSDTAVAATISLATEQDWDFVSLTNIAITGAGSPAYAGGHSTNGGGNTGVVFAMGHKLVIATEAESSLAFNNPIHSLALPLATETDLALGITHPIRIAVSIATESDLALAFNNPIKKVHLVLASESDSVLAWVHSKRKTVPISVESESAISVRFGRSYPITMATVTNTALPVTIGRAGTFAMATEADSAIAINSTKKLALVMATESDSAIKITRVGAGHIVIGKAVETEVALPIRINLNVVVYKLIDPEIIDGLTHIIPGMANEAPGPAFDVIAAIELAAGDNGEFAVVDNGIKKILDNSPFVERTSLIQ